MIKCELFSGHCFKHTSCSALYGEPLVIFLAKLCSLIFRQQARAMVGHEPLSFNRETAILATSYRSHIKAIFKHRRYAQYTEGIETEAKTKQLEQLIIEE